MCDTNLLTFDKDGGSQLLEGLSFAHFTLDNCEVQINHIVTVYS